MTGDIDSVGETIGATGSVGVFDAVGVIIGSTVGIVVVAGVVADESTIGVVDVEFDSGVVEAIVFIVIGTIGITGLFTTDAELIGCSVDVVVIVVVEVAIIVVVIAGVVVATASVAQAPNCLFQSPFLIDTQ